ncbi:MAG: MoaD/ThiS family protein [Vicinamibacterales bacterium]
MWKTRLNQDQKNLQWTLDEASIAAVVLNTAIPVPHVTFTPHLQRFLDAPPRDVGGATVAEALEQVFADNPRLRHYVLDERGAVRQHVTVFVGDAPVVDRRRLSDPVAADTEIFVLQALSGGE